MDIPTSSLQRFGVKTMGKAIEWGYVDPVKKELSTILFHPKVGITFDEILEFQTARQLLVREMRAEANEMKRQIDALDPDDPETAAKAEIIATGDAEVEKDRFNRQVDSALLLILDEERPTIEPLLRKGHPNEIRELISHLQNVVITKTAATVEAVAHVDPTLPPVPADSSSTEDSGPDSGSEAAPTSED